MLIKQKLKLYEKQKGSKGDYSSKQSGQTKAEAQKNAEMDERMGKINWMMEKYLWQYVDKIDDKLEEASEKIMKKIDKYVVGELPEKFQLEDDLVEHPNESPAKLGQALRSAELEKEDDLMQQLQAEIGEGGSLPN